MPFKANDSLDDEILLDGTNGFTTGQVSATRPDNIANTSYSDGLNLDYDDFGNLISRPGCVPFSSPSVLTTLWESISTNWESTTLYFGSSISSTATVISGFFFDTAASERLIIGVRDGASNQLYYSNSSGLFQAISGSSFNSSANYIYFAQLNEKLFYADGYSSLAYITAANANSSITAGKISRIDVINEGDGHSNIPTVTIDPPSPGPGTTATAVAVISGAGNMVAVNITNPGSGYTTAPSVSFSTTNQSHAVAFISLAPPAKPIFLTTHTQRLFCVSADTAAMPDEVRFSDILDGETWDPSASIRVGGDGDSITGLYSWFGYKLLVFKERSIWAIDADPQADPADWVVSLISGNIGCVSHRSIAGVGADVLFLSRDGIRSLAQIQAGTQTDVGLPLSAPIDDVLSQMDKTQYSICDAIYWNNRYLLSFPYKTGTAAQTTNNRVVVYHLLAKSWLGVWDNWTVYDFVYTAFRDLGQALMFCGKVTNLTTGSGQIYAFNDYLADSRLTPVNQAIYRDSGQSFETYVVTKAFNMNEPMIDKIGYNVQFSTDNPYASWAPEISWSYSLNMGGSFTSLDNKVTLPYSTYKYQKSYNLISKGRWNSIQFKQRCTDGRMSVQSVITTAFPQSIKPQQ